MSRFVPPPDNADWPRGHRLALNDLLPVPELARLALTVGARAVAVSLPEKTRWAVAFSYGDRACVLALQKFGPRLYVDLRAGENVVGASGPAAPDTLPNNIRGLVDGLVKDLNRAIRGLEKDFLQQVADSQLRRGAVTVANEYYTIREMYAYFRDKAKSVLTSTPPSVSTASDPDYPLAQFVAEYNARNSAGRESFFNRIAAVTAFFSLLEHTPVLLLAFTSFDPETDDLRRFIGGKWSDKWKRIFPLSEPTSKSLYDRLIDVAERHRNFFAHGGFGKAGTTLYRVEDMSAELVCRGA